MVRIRPPLGSARDRRRAQRQCEVECESEMGLWLVIEPQRAQRGRLGFSVVVLNHKGCREKVGIFGSAWELRIFFAKGEKKMNAWVTIHDLTPYTDEPLEIGTRADR